MDSDEEYERRPRGRDKFRRERSDYNDRSGRRDERSSRREEWSDTRRRTVWGESRRKDYREFDRDRRDSGGRHHEISPPMKRVRREWDNSGFQGDYGGYNPMMANQWVSPMEIQQSIHQRPFDNAQHPVDPNAGPSMMSFKQFLNSMDDTIDDLEAVKKYQEYKVEFRKTQIADFFTTHKDEEWFRNKYHPDDSLSNKKTLKVAVRKRAVVFVDMLQSGWFEKYSLTANQGEDIIKLLDAAVIKFEGGTDLDLQILDKPVEQETKPELGTKDSLPSKIDSQNGNQDIGLIADPVSPSSVPLPETPAPASALVKNIGFKAEDIKPLEMSDPSPEQVKLKEEAKKYHQQQLEREQKEDEGQQKPEPKIPRGKLGQKRKRKRNHREPYYYDENGESESESESDIESEPAPPGEESASTDAQERAAEESLLPPGVDIEPISSDDVMVANQAAETKEDVKLPGTEENPDRVEPKLPESNKDSEKEKGADMEKEREDKQELTDEKTETKIVPEESATAVPEQKEETKMETENIKEEITMEIGEAQVKESNTVEKENIESLKQEEIGDQVKELPESEEKMDLPGSEDVATNNEESKESENVEPEPLKEPTTPRALHQTLSLFVRNVPPKISHNDITLICTRFPGFMRVVLSDPSPDRKFSRRGWITFKPDVSIKDICWSINNIKIKDIELNPIVNRELARRARSVSGAAVLKHFVKTDINMARKLIEQLDEKFELWKNNEEEPLKNVEEKTTVEEKGEVEKPEDSNIEAVPTEEPPSLPKETKVEIVALMPTSNPVLALLPPDLSHDVSTMKEDATMTLDGEEGQIAEDGAVHDDGKDPLPVQTSSNPPPVVDGDLIKLLDQLLLYLRIVHSLDYYSGAEYLYEDDMPNRCGIIHIRNPLPEKINYNEVTGWHKNLHQKLDQHLQEKKCLSDEDANEMGKKDHDQEMDKFIQANTQELAKDKWLCPLSGKKFRGPEFVKKHIFNKHADKVEGVKTEITFFNNFVYDPERPHEPEVKAATQSTPGSQPFPGGVVHPVGVQGGMGWGRGGVMIQQGGRGGFVSPHVPPNYRSGPDQYNNRGQTFPPKARRGVGRRDPRQIVEYKDLDAPGSDDVEFF